MHAFLRAPHLVSTRVNAIRCCRQCHLHLWCGCRTKVQLSNRLLHINSPSVHVLVRQEYSSKLHSGLNNKDWYQDAFTIRYFSTSNVRFEKEPLKPSSKVEVTVQELKKKKEDAPTEIVPKVVAKKSLRQRVVDELVHYYHGFRLLFIDIKISAGLVWRLLNGKTLTRREHRLLVRTVGNLFRLVPFSVFIIVPFMELLLPFFIKFFPGMLPSTFQTATEKEDKFKQNLKVKLEMAKFLQQTLDEMAVQHKDHNSQLAKEFSEWFQKVRTSGEHVSNIEIMKFSKLFEDEITLDSLTRSQLVALCRLLEVQTLGTNNLLRFQLRMKLRSLAADDKMIQKEGVDSLSLAEVQQACRARGMRAYGVSEDRLRTQLKQWLDLSLNEKVPASLLLLSRAMMLPETIPTSDKLKATISSLPETLLTQTKAAIGEKEGKIDNKVMLEVLKEEERKVKEERKEQREEQKKKEMQDKKKEEIVDKAPIVSLSATPELKDPAKVISAEKTPEPKKEEHIVTKDLQALEDALDEISKEKKFIVEKGEIEELKEQMADYQEDVHDLEKAVAEQPKPEIKETKAAQRLFKRVNKMIGKMDKLLTDLESKEKQLKQDLAQKDLASETTDKKKEELLKIDDIMAAIKKIKDVPDESRLEQIKNVLGKMDDDRDGSIKVEDILKVIEFIGKENVQLSTKQLDELIDLIDKEEILEVEDKIEKALQKEKEMKQAEKQVQSKSGQKPDPPSGGESPPPKKTDKEQVSVNAQPPPKPKIESQQKMVTPPPPVSSIDSSKPKDSTKVL